MSAKIVDLKQWEIEHPPIMRLMMAHQRCLVAWWSLFFSLPRLRQKNKY